MAAKSPVGEADSAVVMIDRGLVEEAAEDDVITFHGIPHAAPSTGGLR